MSFIKRQFEHYERLRCEPVSGSVCLNCLGDDGLRKHATALHLLKDGNCRFCKEDILETQVVELSEIIEYIAECINEEWCSPDDELGFDSSEGGFIGDTYEIDEIFELIDYQPDNHLLYQVLCSAFPETYARINHMQSSDSEIRITGWNEFKQTVKHSHRYTFWTLTTQNIDEPLNAPTPAGHVIADLMDVIGQFELATKIEVGTRFWRARGDSRCIPNQSMEFTTPPRKIATKPNRMSPAGIPMMYCCDNLETAFLEINAKAMPHAAAAQFQVLSNFYLLDLTRIPELHSYFDAFSKMERQSLLFLNYFSRDISRAIDGNELEYIPTQVFTEYLRYNYRTGTGESINGIRYRSAHNSTPSYVLFFEQHHCLSHNDSSQQILAYCEDTYHIYVP